MSTTKKKKKHIDFIPHNVDKSRKSKHRVIWVFAIFFALTGLGIAALSTNDKNIWWVVAPVIGLIIGIFSGKQIEKEIFKKS